MTPQEVEKLAKEYMGMEHGAIICVGDTYEAFKAGAQAVLARLEIAERALEKVADGHTVCVLKSNPLEVVDYEKSVDVEYKKLITPETEEARSALAAIKGETK